MDSTLEQNLREMNEALLVSSVHQHELTEQAQKAEAALREGHARFEALFEVSPIGMYLVDSELRIRLVSQTARAVFGDLGELIGVDLEEVIHVLWPPAIAHDIVARFRHTLATGDPYASPDFCAERSDRHVREYYDWQICRITLPEEQYGVVCYFIDVSERRKSDRALAKALAYGDDIIATLREPFVVLDSSLRVKTANRSFYESFQVSKQETENRYLYELGNGQWDIPSLRILLNHVLSRSQSIHNFEVEHSFPALGRKTMLLNARPFPPDSKNPELILLAAYDVSAARQRSAELAESARHKDEFLATLAHELRNPLAPIRSAVQLLGMKGLQETDMNTARQIIARQVTIMVRLIDDLLDVSRISRNRLDMRKERVELAALIEAAVESSHPLIQQCGHELTVNLPSQTLNLDADPVRIAQVFVNLLNNAAKYTKPGGHIWLTAERDGNDAVVQVRDNGIGISANMLSCVFDIFTQVDRLSAPSQGGLGIGLTLVRRLVEMHGGSIEARSGGLDQGSEFIVRLPLIPPQHERSSNSTEPATKLLSGRRILLVDDNQDLAESLAMLLRLRGNDVRIAHDGLAALETAETFRPELVLLDIGLPKLGGHEVAQRIRAQPWGRDIVLVALTACGQVEDRRRSEEAGFNLHVVKPVYVAALEDMLAGLRPYRP